MNSNFDRTYEYEFESTTRIFDQIERNSDGNEGIFRRQSILDEDRNCENAIDRRF